MHIKNKRISGFARIVAPLATIPSRVAFLVASRFKGLSKLANEERRDHYLKDGVKASGLAMFDGSKIILGSMVRQFRATFEGCCFLPNLRPINL